MPGIFEARCLSCDFKTPQMGATTFVALSDGSEQVCPHPGEETIAEKLTGCSWRELADSGRIRYRYPFLCLECGEADLYGLPVSARTHIGAIIEQPEHADGTPCSSCGRTTLHPLSGERPKRGLKLILASIVIGLAGVGFVVQGLFDIFVEADPTNLLLGVLLLGVSVGVACVEVVLARRSRDRGPACPSCQAGTLVTDMVTRA